MRDQSALTLPIMFLTLAELSDQVCYSPCRNWLSVRREQVSQGSQVTRNKVQVENRTHLTSSCVRIM